MCPRDHHEDGFTFVELMIVVLIIGILVSTAIPVYVKASDTAQARSCQASQRTIYGARLLSESSGVEVPADGQGVFDVGGSDWYPLLVPEWIAKRPICPAQQAAYYLNAAGQVVGDKGETVGFVLGHSGG